jgi:hypothetical protein
MEQLNYYDLENILSKCVSGDIDMHEPIEVTNKLQNQRIEISVLKHLLILCNSNKQSLIHILSALRYQIKNKILELIDENSFIRHYIQNVINEWRLDISPVDMFKDGLDQCGYSEGSDMFDYQEFINQKQLAQEGGRKIIELEKGMRHRQEEFKPFTKDYSEQIKEKVKDLHTECYDCIGKVKNYVVETSEKHKMMDPRHRDILIDLSCKSKPTYLEYSNKIKQDESEVFSSFLNEANDLDIPNNIHTIFLNYLITLNMLKKEMNYINNSLKGVLTEMQPKIVMLTKFMDGLNELEIEGDESNEEEVDNSGENILDRPTDKPSSFQSALSEIVDSSPIQYVKNISFF